MDVCDDMVLSFGSVRLCALGLSPWLTAVQMKDKENGSRGREELKVGFAHEGES